MRREEARRIGYFQDGRHGTTRQEGDQAMRTKVDDSLLVPHSVVRCLGRDALNAWLPGNLVRRARVDIR